MSRSMNNSARRMSWLSTVTSVTCVFLSLFHVGQAGMDSLGMSEGRADFKRRYAFSGFESAGFFQYAAADTNFFHQMRCRKNGDSCSVHAQCCSAFCPSGQCTEMRKKPTGLWGNTLRRRLRIQGHPNKRRKPSSSTELSRIPTTLTKQTNKTRTKLEATKLDSRRSNLCIRDPVGSTREQPCTDSEMSGKRLQIPNEGDNQLRQALMSALKDFQRLGNVYQECWSPFLEPEFISGEIAVAPADEQQCMAEYSYPLKEEAVGTFQRVFDSKVINWGTYTEEPPFTYFVDSNESEFWGFEAEMVKNIMMIFNEHYKANIAFRFLYLPASRGLFNNVADSLYNDQVDVFFGKFSLTASRCSIVGCGCPYLSTGTIALMSSGKHLHGKVPEKLTNLDDSEVIIGVMANDTHLSTISKMFPKVVLRLFWSLWALAEHMIREGIHASLCDISVTRFLETLYKIHCTNCRLLKTFHVADENIGWAFRQFPAPKSLREAQGQSAELEPLPDVYSIKQHFVSEQGSKTLE